MNRASATKEHDIVDVERTRLGHEKQFGISAPEDHSHTRLNVAGPEEPWHQGLDTLLLTLPERHRLVLQGHLGLIGGKQATLEEIGRQLGVTRQRACAIEASALTKLRREPAVWDRAARHIRGILKAAGGVARFERLLHDVGKSRPDGRTRSEFFVKLTLKLDREIVETRIDGMPIWGLRSSPVTLIPRIQRLCRSMLSKSRIGLSLDTVITSVLDELKCPSLDGAFVARAIEGCRGIRTVEGWLFGAPSRIGPRLLKTASILRESGEPLHFKTITERLNSSMKRESSARAVQAFLERNRDVFVRTGRGVFGLREWDMPGKSRRTVTD